MFRLTTGSRIGSYEILAAIGAGGMGEVYRARDTQLNRNVAIKTLPDEFIHHGDRIARFEREAQIVALLNHPNIAGIHELQKSSDGIYLVLELVEGDNLADRLKKGPLAIDEALHICRQIADALEAAHEKGIVHRDLKPANIKLTPDGRIKVLDFGLAKIFDGETADTLTSNTPTQKSGRTVEGAILGTPAYMSPEQARGKTVDWRTDLWSFGCILYELLTGKQSFPGETSSDSVAAILRADVDWNALPVQTPPSVRRLLERCLDRDPRQRLQSAGDSRLEIESGLRELNLPPAAHLRNAERKRQIWMAAAIAAILSSVFTIATIYNFRSTQADRSTIRFTINTPPTTYPAHLYLNISPDGKDIAFVANDGTKQMLWLRAIESLEAKPLPGTDGAVSPFWSPDSRLRISASKPIRQEAAGRQWLLLTGSGYCDSDSVSLRTRGGPVSSFCAWRQADRSLAGARQ